ncbi:MAG TPA: hypothetical protein VH814_10980 [Steroidobacteraceae bacterium]
MVLVFLLFCAAAAQAYVGPGLGLGVIGAIFGALLAVIMSIAGVVWYPIKRLLKKVNSARAADTGGDPNSRSK